MGRFIEEKILKKKKRKGSYQSESGTISDKLGFCEKAIQHLKNWNDMTSEAQELTKKIYKFIISNNPIQSN